MAPIDKFTVLLILEAGMLEQYSPILFLSFLLQCEKLSNE